MKIKLFIGLGFWGILGMAQEVKDSLQVENPIQDSIELVNLPETEEVVSLETETPENLVVEEKGKLWQNLKYDVGNMVGGTWNGFTQPIRWDKKDWTIVGATAVGWTLLYLVDQQTSDFFTRQSDDIPGFLKDFGWGFGRPEANYSLTAGIYLFGLLTDNERVRETGVLLVTSSIIGGVAQQTMKTVVGRGRPNIEKGPNQFKIFKGGQDYGSFPSGHTILVTTTMYALSKQFDNYWIKGGLYALGAITPISRLWVGAHWLTDVTLSLVMSVAIVEGVDFYLKRHKKYSHQAEEYGIVDHRKIKWNFTLGAAQVGFVGTF